MRNVARVGALCAISLAVALPLGAQERSGVMGDLMKDVEQVHKKIVALTTAMPESAYAWRPGKGVRSTGEVFMHLAADNYFTPAALGTTVPVETGINGKSYDTAVAFEKKTRTRAQIIAEVEKSFGVLTSAMGSFPDAKMDAPVEVFGQKTTGRAMWVGTVTHLHEHLGQLIAYARSNAVTPPWSK
jgi:hypothetical protein